MNLIQYEQFLSSKRAVQEILIKKQKVIDKKISDSKSRMSNLDEALDIMNAVAVLSQREYKEIYEELVTQALQYVFDESYSFEMVSTISRNQPEIQMYVIEDDKRHLLKDDELGYGVIDIVSLTLRIVSWAIHHFKTDGVFILDEPLKNLDDQRFEAVDHMLHQFSEMLFLQFIIVTQRHKLAEIGDASFLVTRPGKVSKVERIV